MMGGGWRNWDACPACTCRCIRVYRGRWFGKVVQCQACLWRATAPKVETEAARV